jgi:subtilisin family serine protease
MGLGSNPGANADVVNVSWGKGSQKGMRWSDRSFDYWARDGFSMIVAAAGNTNKCGTYLCSPAKGWNVISVGAYDDLNNANWSDDTMAASSSYVNPSLDREKPELVAPGVQITGIGQNGNLVT